MKKFVILLLCVVILCSGCRTDTVEPTVESTIASTPGHTDPPPTSSTAETEPPMLYSVPLIAVSMPFQEYALSGSDNTIVFRYHCQDLHLTLEDPHVADAIALDFLNAVDVESGAAAKLYREANTAYTGQKDWEPYSMQVTYHTMRLDNSILSMYGSHVAYTGNPRLGVTNSSLTYDLLTGQRLSLRGILTKNFSADALSKLLVDALSPQASQGLLYADYAYVVSEMFSTNTPVENWYLSHTGLCFYFAPYDIAPYSTGTVLAEIPYEQLTGILNDAYFPAEQIVLTGNPSVTTFHSADTEALNQFAELILSKNAAEYLLTTNGAVQNLRIQLGTWSEDRTTFTPDTTVFASMALCSTDGIMLQVDDDSLGRLAIRYESAGNAVTVPVSDLITGK